jgi:16S rRNA C967 or C1407 C5-methylase (RsmB/RsmF family)
MARTADFDLAAFEKTMQEPPPVSIRLHPRKSALPEWGGNWQSEQVRWHPQGYYLSERPSFTLDPLWHAGAYYVQEAASMFLYEGAGAAVSAARLS